MTSNNLAPALERLRLKWLAAAPRPARVVAEPTPATMRKPVAPPPPQLQSEPEYVETFPAAHLHGHFRVGSIARSDASPIGIPHPPANWAFLDTETTGLSGGTGTYAFLIGVGVWRDDPVQPAFHVHQFFLRDFSEEPRQLEDLAGFLAPYDVLVTYNGKSFDAPLLETRYRMSRRQPPHEKMLHLDVLHASRRLWKTRLDSCRLVELEQEVLGYTRVGDVPGFEIPARYFDYLRSGRMDRLEPVLYHNRMDILTLACLTSVVLAAVGDPLGQSALHPCDLYGLAAWLARLGRDENVLELYARAARDPRVGARARPAMAAIYKRRGDYERAVPLWKELETRESRTELAKYYEHRARDYGAALDAARVTGDERRINRLERKLTIMR